MGPIAWAMGTEELRRIDSGTTDPTQRGTVVAGRICGMIATILMAISLLFVIYMIVIISGETHHHYRGY